MRFAIVVGIVSGCAANGQTQTVTHLTATMQIDPAIHGADLAASVGVHGVQLGLDLEGQRLTRAMDPTHHAAGGIDVFARVSLFGLLISDGDHRLERWFDLGFDAGAGGGITSPGTFGQAWVGGWAELGLWTGAQYPVLVLGVRRASDTSPWDDQTLFTIGLGLANRSTSSDPSLLGP